MENNKCGHICIPASLPGDGRKPWICRHVDALHYCIVGEWMGCSACEQADAEGRGGGYDPMTPPDWREHRDVTVKVDRLTLGAACLLVSVLLYVWCRRRSC